jgi:hypothetical protein
MHRRSVVAVDGAGLTGSAVVGLVVLALAVLTAAAIPAAPAQAGSSGLVVKVTPNRGLVDRQTVTITGRGLAGSGVPRTWFVAECTVAVRGHMNPATDTPHCDLTDAQPLHVTQNGTFSTRYRVRAGIIGDGYCGTAGHTTCVLGVGTAQGLGTVVRIVFKTPPPGATTPTTPATPATTTTSTTSTTQATTTTVS